MANNAFIITLLANYCHLFPSARADLCNMSAERFRIFRAEKTYSVSTGKWYFELEVRGGFKGPYWSG